MRGGLSALGLTVLSISVSCVAVEPLEVAVPEGSQSLLLLALAGDELIAGEALDLSGAPAQELSLGAGDRLLALAYRTPLSQLLLDPGSLPIVAEGRGLPLPEGIFERSGDAFREAEFSALPALELAPVPPERCEAAGGWVRVQEDHAACPGGLELGVDASCTFDPEVSITAPYATETALSAAPPVEFPCPSDQWPEVSGPALYVRSGGSGDGSSPETPLGSLFDAGALAGPGDTIAVAAGFYGEGVFTAARVVGLCPGMTTISGTITIEEGGSLERVLVAGSPLLLFSGTSSISDVVIRDATINGFSIRRGTRVYARDVRIERSAQHGVLVEGVLEADRLSIDGAGMTGMSVLDARAELRDLTVKNANVYSSSSMLGGMRWTIADAGVRALSTTASELTVDHLIIERGSARLREGHATLGRVSIASAPECALITEGLTMTVGDLTVTHDNTLFSGVCARSSMITLNRSTFRGLGGFAIGLQSASRATVFDINCESTGEIFLLEDGAHLDASRVAGRAIVEPAMRFYRGSSGTVSDFAVDSPGQAGAWIETSDVTVRFFSIRGAGAFGIEVLESARPAFLQGLVTESADKAVSDRLSADSCYVYRRNNGAQLSGR